MQRQSVICLLIWCSARKWTGIFPEMSKYSFKVEYFSACTFKKILPWADNIRHAFSLITLVLFKGHGVMTVQSNQCSHSNLESIAMLSLWNVSSCTAEQLLSVWEISLLSIQYICPSLPAETLDRAIWMSDRQNRYKTYQRQVSTLWLCCQTLYKESDSLEWWAVRLLYLNSWTPQYTLYFAMHRESHWFSCNMFQKCNYDATIFNHRLYRK